MCVIKNKTILVTGGAGFVGSYVLEQLLEEDVKEIIVIDNLVRGSRKNIETSLASGKVRLIEGDICNRDFITPLFKDVDYCFHLAALRITHCAAHPDEALAVMYNGTYNVLQACVAHKVQRVVFASSASVYGQADVFPTNEKHHPYNNFTLYGAAKAANELMLRSFQQMYGLEYNILRYFNIYGPRMDTHGKYTEVFIRWYHLIKEGKPPLIFGDGKQTMDFVYISEVAKATILALKTKMAGEVFNVAEGRETSLEELCLTLLEVMGVPLKPEYVPIPEDRKKVEVLRR
ncbi:MAG: NAD-dependent epimerase/dehydratase family protein, partial [Candidatus Omnitrophica bacterium]|nr:NAD-dependent epimerase/dehydratase family protein [Candidatus Omnitrophota bacterium]